MKNVFVFIVILGLTGLSFNNSGAASTQSIPLKDYQSITFYTETSNLQNYNLLKKIVLLPKGDFNEIEATQMILRINNVDSSILEKLVQQGINIKLFTGKLTDEPSVSHLEGEKPRGYSEKGHTWDEVPGIGGSKLVLAKIGYSEKGKGHGSINLELHELGHSVDNFVYDSIRNDQIFLKIWRKEVTKLFPGETYFLQYPEEYFAETFALYYLSAETRNQLKKSAPLTYSLFQQLILIK
ncbi:anthrax toxin lethal factor-related metalloendopeptidase [Ferdinandcohnia quinoae]|uniref:Toxin n=1 Tax=Fredinandcohnia quinoae TaxID=2918902 RepID=A0AAW5E9P1_9BACI|nr:toxin [Fredinandcohnia sp. SECRCQ15]MCH1626380.1 toxin [Fredinandcohnia sp. SECRCQ15]